MSAERELLARLLAGPATGDALARDAGLTRAAMWKRIETLREAGVRIDAKAGRGYALAEPVSLLDAGAIERALAPACRASCTAKPPTPSRIMMARKVTTPAKIAPQETLPLDTSVESVPIQASWPRCWSSSATVSARTAVLAEAGAVRRVVRSTRRGFCGEVIDVSLS